MFDLKTIQIRNGKAAQRERERNVERFQELVRILARQAKDLEVAEGLIDELLALKSKI